MSDDTTSELREQIEPYLRGLLDRPDILRGEFDQTVKAVMQLIAAQKQRWADQLKKELEPDLFGHDWERLCAALDGVIGEPGGLETPSEPEK